MRLARIRHEGPDGAEARIVIARSGGGWVDVRMAERLRLERAGASTEAAGRIAAAVVPGSLSQALAGGEAFFEAVAAAAEGASGAAQVLPETAFVAPVDPPAYRDFMAFEEHFVTAHGKSGRPIPDVLYELPVSYMGSAQAFVGPDDEIPWPSYTSHMDYELELGIVVGRSGRDLDPEEALAHVLGLTILNDFSARDIQLREISGRTWPVEGQALRLGCRTVDRLSRRSPGWRADDGGTDQRGSVVEGNDGIDAVVDWRVGGLGICR